MVSLASKVVPLAVISPVRDEARYIRKTLDAMVAQTWRPQEWVIVDDGSRDETPAIVAEYAARHDFIRLVQRPDRGRRQLGGGVIAAFEYGRQQLARDDYRFIAKVDGDLSFPPRYLEIMLGELQRNPALAAVSGKVFRPEGDRLVYEFQIDEHVAGQFKLYRRQAFEAVGGFEQTILWDGIDVHRCRMAGWQTRSFLHPEARIFHHRQMGSSDRSVYRGRVRLGRGIHFMGYDPWYAIASGLFRMHEKPYVIGGLIIIAAYLYAALRREPQYADPGFRRDLRRWQRRQLARRLLRPWQMLAGGGARSPKLEERT
jgi:poly-beta-1,6-N-acetyl-D-glucosamine synthase